LNINEKAIEMFEQNNYEEAMELFHRAVHESRNEVIRESIEAKTAEIEDVQNEEVEENWTENDKKELIKEYTEENNCYKTMIERIKSGYVPGLEFETDYIGACYLFGCKRHNHLEYEK